MGELGCQENVQFNTVTASRVRVHGKAEVQGMSELNGGVKLPVETLTAARVVTAADSGTTFICSGAAGKAITLPSVADAGAGFNCKFIVGQAFATTDWVITATAAIMVGGINELEVDTSDDGPSTVAGTTINIELGAETIGDYVEFLCDGTKFFINGQSKLDGAFTLA
jgi:hypothetical protein